MTEGPETPFDLVRMNIDGHPVFVAYGELDVVSAPKLHEAISYAIGEKPTAILVDMANVSFIDSTALGALVVAQRHLADAGGELRLVAVPEKVAMVFEISGLSERFRIFPDMGAASTPTRPSE
jgi:anti-sigma B factor antagonist